jgi:hypothetical protein
MGESAQISYEAGMPIVSYCCIQGWTGDLGGLGNMGDDPLFVDLEDGDLHLSDGSACIDAAYNGAVPADVFDLDGDGDTAEPLPFDVDGNARFVDDPYTDDTGDGTPPIVDMGAHEFQLPECPGDADGDGMTGHSDLGLLLADWGCTGGDCPGDIDGDGVTGHSDLGILLGDWGCGT